MRRGSSNGLKSLLILSTSIRKNREKVMLAVATQRMLKSSLLKQLLRKETIGGNRCERGLNEKVQFVSMNAKMEMEETNVGGT